MTRDGWTNHSPETAQPYRPIRDYALIGDCHGAALVGRDGGIDWCCLGRFDAEPTFCRILDAERGGYLSVAPVEEHSATRSYLENTNILQTTLTTTQGTVVLTDFMPVGRRPGCGTHDYVDLVAPKLLIRIVEVREGAAQLRIHYRPSMAFGRETARLHLHGDRISTEGGPVLYHDVDGFSLIGDTALAAVRLQKGQKQILILAAQPCTSFNPLDRIDLYTSVTIAFWREWIAYCRYRGPYEGPVKRSLFAIKLLIYAPSGAIVAAPTTSLPEGIGGNRNWDYRYCWLRDSAFTLYALAVSGYGGEARRFCAYLQRVCAATAPNLRIMYGIGGETELNERTLDHLDGYCGSRPVRQGNGAYTQRQIDIYGEILDWALLFQTLGGTFDQQSRGMLGALADFVADHWHEPDQGLWEMRGPPLHHLHGKIMSWVALDRAIRLLGAQSRWESERDRIVAEVHARGLSAEGDHFVQAYDHLEVDAALLLIPMTGFPVHDRILTNTIEEIERELRSGNFLYRYKNEDGLEGDEGAFLICSFWLVDALLHIGRKEEAAGLFHRLVECANDVGLYSEEIDPGNHAFLGNFPQTYTQLAVISSAVHLALYEKQGVAALKGTHAERAQRVVSATLGWRAVFAAFMATWRVGRIWSSKHSMLPSE